MKKHRVALINGIFAGVMIIVTAVSVVLCMVGVIPVSAYKMFMTVVMGGIAIRSLIGLTFTPFMLGMGHLAYLYGDYINIPNTLPAWLLILASTLVGVGIDIIVANIKKSVRKKNADNQSQWYENNNVNSNNNANSNNNTNSNHMGNSASYISGNSIQIKNGFGQQTRYVNSEDFSDAHIENAFGQLNVYFDSVSLMNNQAQLSIENGFGELNVYFPAGWRMNLTEENGLGEILVNGNPSTDLSAPLVSVHVQNGMGKVNLFFN